MNDVHLSVAKKIGIEPVSSREGAEHASRDMVEIKTNDYYEVEELTHSIPYLVPEAANLLEDIGKNFQDSLKNLNAKHFNVGQVDGVNHHKEYGGRNPGGDFRIPELNVFTHGSQLSHGN